MGTKKDMGKYFAQSSPVRAFEFYGGLKGTIKFEAPSIGECGEW